MKIQTNFLSYRLKTHYSIIVLFFNFFSNSVLADPLPLIVINKELPAKTASPVTINSKAELLKYTQVLQIYSQIIAKDYFYISQDLHVDRAKDELKETITGSDTILNILAANIKDKKMQNLLSYINDLNLEMKAVWAESYSVENASQVIDYSETLFEGTQSIIDYLAKQTRTNNTLYNDILKQELVLQRISKFYIAYQSGINDKVMHKKLTDSIMTFDKGLKEIGSYKYLDISQEFTLKKLEHYWSISKKYYEGMKKGELTLMIYYSTNYMKNYLDKILGSENLALEGIRSKNFGSEHHGLENLAVKNNA